MSPVPWASRGVQVLTRSESRDRAATPLRTSFSLAAKMKGSRTGVAPKRVHKKYRMQNGLEGLLSCAAAARHTHPLASHGVCIKHIMDTYINLGRRLRIDTNCTQPGHR